VVGVQWERMENGTLGEQLNPFAAEMFRSIRAVEPGSASEQSAYDRWHDQTSDREEARNARIHGAVGVIPTPLWIVLFLSAGMIFMFMLFFADSGERAIVQAMMIGAVTVIITATLLLLTALDNPFHSGIGGLRPVAMERSLKVIDQELAVAGVTVTPPCDAAGNPT